MPLFVPGASSTLAHDVYAIDSTTPAAIQAIGTGIAVNVGQWPWGPTESLVYPASPAELLATFAPAGMTRTGSAVLSWSRKAWPTLGIVRAGDPTAVAATASLPASSTTIVTLTANSKGTEGNAIVATKGAASDGNANHWNLTVSVSGASGTTSEIYADIDTHALPYALPNFVNSSLVASMAVINAGTPDSGNVVFSGGTNGSVTSAAYVGTPGADDLGFALLEADDTINHVFTDDVGNSLRAAVNAGLLAHVDLMTDRVGFINGNSGQSASSAQSDVANYRSERIVYVDPWTYVYDQQGTLRLTPPSSWGASVAAQLPPSTAISWRDDRVSALLDGIISLEANRSGVRAQNDASGISTLIKRKKGGYCFEAGLNSSGTPGRTSLTGTRMRQFIAKSAVDSWETLVDAPNIRAYQQDVVNSLDVFLDGMKQNAKDTNAAFLTYIVDYGILSIGASNTNASIQAGNFAVNAQVEIGASMSRIYLMLEAGETVVVNVA